MESLNVYVLSDYIVETVEGLAKSVIEQFDIESYTMQCHPYVNDIENADSIIDSILEPENSVIIYTIFNTQIKERIYEKCKVLNIASIDIYDNILNRFEQLLGYPPKNLNNSAKKMDKSYFSRIEAVEFAVKYDDGKDYRGILEADIVLIGISRTSKTPLSMYLAHKALKVANVPLVPEATLPKELFEIDKARIIGLVANPKKLNEIRIERLKALGLDGNAVYADMERIDDELAYANQVFERLGCKTINVSNNAIEETAEIILNHYRTSHK